MQTVLILLILAGALSGCATAGGTRDVLTLRAEVMAAERAFARTMSERDHSAFASFLAEEAIFYSGDTPIRGKTAVTSEWRPFFEGDTPPFTWDPDGVEVLDSGTLALSTGPVYDPTGTVVGRFNSVWRRESPGRWLVVFDKGSPVCNCAATVSP